MFVPDALKDNAFRVLRLSVECSAAEVHKASAGLKRAAILGVGAATADDMPALGNVGRSEQDLRTAIGRLQNTALRIRDRMFWFHRPPGSAAGEAGADARHEALARFEDAARSHDAALYQLIAVLAGGLDAAALDRWVDTLRRLHEIATSQNYRQLCWLIEEHGEFEPMALPSEVNTALEEAVRVAGETLLSAARDACLRGDEGTALGIVSALMELEDTGRWSRDAQEELLSGPVRALKDICNAVRDEHGPKIKRAKDYAARNRTVCEAALAHYHDQVEPALGAVLNRTPANHAFARQAREMAGLTLHAIAADFTWAEEFVTAEKLNEEALALVRDLPSAARVNDVLPKIRDSARRQRVLGNLRPITSAPMLGTLNGIGCTIYGHENYDAETNSYVTTHYFVFAFIPIFPLGRYRVIDRGQRRYSFLGSLPLTHSNRVHAYASVAAILLVTLGLAGQMPRPRLTEPQRRTWGYAATAESSPRQVLKPRIPSSDEIAAGDLKAQVDECQQQLDQLEAKLKPVVDQLKRLQSQIESKETEVAGFDRRIRAGDHIDYQALESKIHSHDNLVRKHRSLQRANKTDFDRYQTLRDSYSRLVEQYNNVVRRL